MNDLVSVIMPAYNTENYIAPAIQSVLDQTYSHLELIIVDDASTDQTLCIAQEYAALHDTIHVYSHQTNKGAAKTREYALRKAQGRYLAFLDSDDLWCPEKLEVQIGVMKTDNIPLSCTYYGKINAYGTQCGSVVKGKAVWTYKDLLKDCPGNSTVIFDRSDYGTIQIPDIKKRNDYVLWLTLAKHYEIRMIGACLSYHRVHAASISARKRDLVGYHYHIYRNIEKLAVHQSLFYVSYWIYKGIKSAMFQWGNSL